MGYRYFTSSSPINFQSSGCAILGGFQTLINDLFYQAPDVYTIQEETVFGSNVYSNVDVRINRAINVLTGEKLGDDFKLIIFKDFNHNPNIGTKYQFENNYWITVNSEIYKNFASSCIVRRCNNILRWTTGSGIYFSEPCAIDYETSRAEDKLPYNPTPVTPVGNIKLYCQLNDNTRKIRAGQRFLFGSPDNWLCFKVFGDGVRNYLNQQTLLNQSATLLSLILGANYVNPQTDDLINGVADAYLDYGNLISGSDIGALDIVIDPSRSYILESGSAIYGVHYYSGSTLLSGSFVFSISGSDVPTDHYTFGTWDDNHFYIINHEKYLSSNLNVLCSGSSGSRIVNIELRGAW